MSRRSLFLHCRLAGLFCLLSWGSGQAFAQAVQVMTVEEAREAARSGEMFLVDIRTPREWRESGVPDVAVPLDMTRKSFIRDLMALRASEPTRKLGLICASGVRSRYVANLLVHNGIEGVVDVPAGMHSRNGWRARKLPLRAAEEPVAPRSAP